MPLVNNLRFDAVTPEAYYFDGVQVDRIYRNGRLVYGRVDQPHITSFVLAPTYGAASAPTAGSFINASWDVEGSVATTVLERRLHGSSTWESQGISAQTGTDSDPLPWPSVDADYRLTVTNSLGETDAQTKTFYRTIPPAFSADGLQASYSPVFAGQAGVSILLQWDVEHGNPFPNLAWSGVPSGHHITDPNRATLPDGNGNTRVTFILSNEALDFTLTLTATNPISNEAVSVSQAIHIPPRGAG